MLRTTKTITISGTSVAENGQVIATMHCSLPTNGAPNSSDNISNTVLYEENIEQVRADIDEFKAYCRVVEDGLRAEQTAETEV